MDSRWTYPSSVCYKPLMAWNLPGLSNWNDLFFLTMLFLHVPHPTGLLPPFGVIATLHQPHCKTKGSRTPQLSLLLAWVASLAQSWLSIPLRSCPVWGEPWCAIAHQRTVGWGMVSPSSRLGDGVFCRTRAQPMILIQTQGTENRRSCTLAPRFYKIFPIVISDWQCYFLVERGECSFPVFSELRTPQTFLLLPLLPHLHHSPQRSLFFGKPQKRSRADIKCGASQFRMVIGLNRSLSPGTFSLSGQEIFHPSHHYWGILED